MSQIFLNLVNISITASWLVLAVIILRFLFKKAPKSIICVLWGLVAVRLIFPFSIESPLSLVPSGETIPLDIEYSKTPTIDTGITSLNTAVNPIIQENFTPSDELTSMNPIQLPIHIGAYLWQIGIVIMALYAIISYIRIKLKVREAIKIDGNVYECDRIPSPFILGVIRPHIYLPSSLSEEAANHVISHEKAHLKRLDYIWKPLGYILLTVYWFNPVLWIAYILLCRDIEYACDEKVVKTMNLDAKKEYSTTLLNLSVHNRYVTACPLAFGESGVKGRIKSVLNYKKSAFWVIMIAIILCIALAVCFLTNPVSNNNTVKHHVFFANSDFSNPVLTLFDKNRFAINYTVGSTGKYEHINNDLVLYSDDGKYTYVFTVDNENLIFNADASLVAPEFPAFDGAVFEYISKENPIREIYYDINNDGSLELCTISDAHSTNVSSYNFNVHYNNQDYTTVDSISFICNFEPGLIIRDGKLMIRGYLQPLYTDVYAPIIRHLNVDIIEDQIQFTENYDLFVGYPEDIPYHMIVIEDEISDMKDGMNDDILKEYYKQDIEDVMNLTTAKHIVIRYFDYDFNSDGLTDKFVIIASPIHSGSGGDSIDILINNGDGTYSNVSGYVMRILDESDQPSFPIYISTQTNGYHDIIIFGEQTRTLSFNGEKYVISF